MIKIKVYECLGLFHVDVDAWIPGGQIWKGQEVLTEIIHGVHPQLTCDAPIALADVVEDVLTSPYALRRVCELGGLRDLIRY